MNSHTSYKVLGIDYGKKKIGLAIYNNESQLSLPFGVIKSQECDEEIKRIVEKNYIKGVVIGIPCDLNGNALNSFRYIEEFASSLAKNIEIPCVLTDESFTTFASNELLKDAGINRKKRNAIDDALAAKIFLEDFFRSELTR